MLCVDIDWVEISRMLYDLSRLDLIVIHSSVAGRLECIKSFIFTSQPNFFYLLDRNYYDVRAALANTRAMGERDDDDDDKD